MAHLSPRWPHSAWRRTPADTAPYYPFIVSHLMYHFCCDNAIIFQCSSDLCIPRHSAISWVSAGYQMKKPHIGNITTAQQDHCFTDDFPQGAEVTPLRKFPQVFYSEGYNMRPQHSYSVWEGCSKMVSQKIICRLLHILCIFSSPLSAVPLDTNFQWLTYIAHVDKSCKFSRFFCKFAKPTQRCMTLYR